MDRDVHLFFCVSNKKEFRYILYKIDVNMIIIDNISGQITVKIPNNLVKSSKPILHLKNTETKKEYDIEIEDTSTSDLWYVSVVDFSNLTIGEYEYEIDGNRGILRIGEVMNKKVYDNNIIFKSYNG